MDKNSFIKISVAIFIILAIIISLFPPFEFGNEMIKTESERRSNSDIANKLPIKEYDLLLGSNKKYFILDYYDFQQKFYNKDTLNFYKDKWSDKKFIFITASADSFLTPQKILHEYSLAERINLKQSYKKLKGFVETLEWRENHNWYPLTANEEGINTATNFYAVRNDFKKSPADWYIERISRLDSTKKYNLYDITQPVYYLLERKLLFSELLVEYILAFFISIIAGYIIKSFVLKRSAMLRKLITGI